MRKTIFPGNLILVLVVAALMLAACGPSPYEGLQEKIAEVDSLLIKARAAGATNIDSLREEQNILATKYIKGMNPAQVPAGDLFAASQLCFFAERYDLAVQVMERKDLEQAEIDFLDLLFQVYCLDNKVEKADTLFNSHILPLSPPGLENYYDYLQWGYIEAGQYESALSVVDQAIEALDSSLTYSLELDKVEIYYNMGEIQNALDIINRLEKQNDLTDKNKKKLAAKKQLYEMIGNPAPSLVVDDWLGSDPMPLEGLKGKVVLLDFWAPWCGPCRAILPFIQDLYDEYKDQGLVVIGVTQYYGRFNQLGQNLKNISPEVEREWVIKFKEYKELTIPTAISKTENGVENAASYGVYGIPHMVLIDREGNVRYYTIGSGQSSEDLLKNGVIELLGIDA